MWDQLAPSSSKMPRIRIIPTYVGSTGREDIIMAFFPNHSHVCGINNPDAHRLWMQIESFPRMWDQRDWVFDHHSQTRIIPTYVGSTINLALLHNVISNHSHVCGINGLHIISIIVECESFPRMWDQPRPWRLAFALFRIIPTYVGSTAPEILIINFLTNHSHVCGINLRSFY